MFDLSIDQNSVSLKLITDLQLMHNKDQLLCMGQQESKARNRSFQKINQKLSQINQKSINIKDYPSNNIKNYLSNQQQLEQPISLEDYMQKVHLSKKIENFKKNNKILDNEEENNEYTTSNQINLNNNNKNLKFISNKNQTQAQNSNRSNNSSYRNKVQIQKSQSQIEINRQSIDLNNKINSNVKEQQSNFSRNMSINSCFSKSSKNQKEKQLKKQKIVYWVDEQNDNSFMHDQWKPPVFLEAACTQALNQAIFMLGGRGIQSNSSSIIYKFCGKNKKWEKVILEGEVEQQELGGPSLNYCNGQLYYFGGETFINNKVKSYNSYMNIIDFNNKTCQRIPNSQEYLYGRKHHCSVTISNVVQIFGGITNQDKVLNDVWYFNTDTNQWNNKFYVFDNEKVENYLSKGIYLHQGDYVSMDNVQTYKGIPIYTDHHQEKIEGTYYYGGRNQNGNALGEMLFLDQSQRIKGIFKIIEAKGKKPIARYGHSLNYCQKQGIFLIYGGRGQDSDFLQDLQVYKIWDHEWLNVTNIQGDNIPRYQHQAQIINNYLYVFGGVNEQGILSNKFSILNFDVSEKLEKKIIQSQIAKQNRIDQQNYNMYSDLTQAGQFKKSSYIFDSENINYKNTENNFNFTHNKDNFQNNFMSISAIKNTEEDENTKQLEQNIEININTDEEQQTNLQKQKQIENEHEYVHNKAENQNQKIEVPPINKVFFDLKNKIERDQYEIKNQLQNLKPKTKFSLPIDHKKNAINNSYNNQELKKDIFKNLMQSQIKNTSKTQSQNNLN